MTASSTTIGPGWPMQTGLAIDYWKRDGRGDLTVLKQDLVGPNHVVGWDVRWLESQSPGWVKYQGVDAQDMTFNDRSRRNIEALSSETISSSIDYPGRQVSYIVENLDPLEWEHFSHVGHRRLVVGILRDFAVQPEPSDNRLSHRPMTSRFRTPSSGH